MMMKKMMFKPSLKKMKGLTLLETMFALALGVLVLIAIMLIYNGTKRTGVQSKVVSDITSIVGGFESYIAAGNPSGAPTMNTVNSAGFLASATPVTPFGQNYAVNAKTDGTGGPVNGVVTVGVSGLLATDPQCAQIGTILGQTKTAAATCSFDMPL